MSKSKKGFARATSDRNKLAAAQLKAKHKQEKAAKIAAAEAKAGSAETPVGVVDAGVDAPAPGDTGMPCNPGAIKRRPSVSSESNLNITTSPAKKRKLPATTEGSPDAPSPDGPLPDTSSPVPSPDDLSLDDPLQDKGLTYDAPSQVDPPQNARTLPRWT